MSVRRIFVCLALAGSSLPGFGGTDPGLTVPGKPRRIAVGAPGPTPEPVPAWDAASVQRLVRIGGDLFQEDAGFYYRVLEHTISARLPDGVASWEELVARALESEPQLGADLARLKTLRHNRLGIVDLELPDGDPAGWAALVHSTGLVRYAEVSTYGVWLDIPPDDPLYSQQWALHNTGQTGGTPGADVDAEAAWTISAGNPAVIVGVLDSGTSVGHQDLVANVWINQDENPTNGVDDDGNGFIDDWRGWDFGNGNNDPNSSFYHGTHVTGIINAVGDNGIGVVGLAGGLGSPGARGMAVAVGEFGPDGGILDDAIIYAADNGARVITLSLSVAQTQAIDEALAYAYQTRDVFIDCAAGNNGPSVSYPANQPTVMAVASTDHNDVKSSFSNPGPQVAVAAPGSDVLSTQLNNTYDESSGTSFAAPYVAGLAALVRGVNPGLTAPEVRQLIIDTADDVGPSGFDNGTGWGRINAFQALSQTGSSDGTIELSAAVYTCDASVSVTVADFDLAGGSFLPILVTSEAEPAGETVVLIENGFGVFGADFDLAPGAASPDGILQVGHDDVVTAVYIDADDGQGGLGVPNLATASTDCAGPLVSDLAFGQIDDDSVVVSYGTDEPGTTVVLYGDSVPPTQQVNLPALVVDHTIPLTGLEHCTTYSVAVGSVDALGNVTTDDNGGRYHTFQTLGDFPGVGLVPCEEGQVQLDRASYGCGDMLHVLLTDFGLNADPEALDQAAVWLTSSSEPLGEWITLVETAADGGAFTGAVPLGPSATEGDGQLAASAGDLITVTYHDADDGAGHAAVVTDLASADCVAPAILDLRVTEISSTRAVIEWTTDEPATSRVDYGPDALLGQFVEDTRPTTNHRMAISAFEACERIFMRVSSEDANGDVRIADAQGTPFGFDLNQIGGLVYHDNFETEDGWQLTGEWQRGAPHGLGLGAGDPDAAFSGTGVLGIDLTGMGSFPGSYEPLSDTWAFSPAFSTVGSTNLELIVRRKLGLAPSDNARIGIRNPFLQMAWTSAGPIDDADWSEYRLNVSALADNRPSIQIGFGIKAVFPGVDYGWNIDEIILKEADAPDYLSCGGCAGEPAFGGLLAAYDPDPCGASGLALEWGAAAAWGSGASGTYEVHRGASADFVPGPANLVAAGLLTTSWTDPGAPVDTPVWYVVRARNDESCVLGEGLSEGNLVRFGATETLDQDPPGAVTDTLVAYPVGDAHIRLEWESVPGVEHYVVRRASLPDFSDAVELGTTVGTYFEDPNAFGGGAAFYAYRVFAVNACDVEQP